MIISTSVWRKSVVTVIAVGGFVSLYEVTTLDSRYAARQAVLRETTALPAPGARLAFSATAYCKGVTTASGVTAQSGVTAAIPSGPRRTRVLSIGLHAEAAPEPHESLAPLDARLLAHGRAWPRSSASMCSCCWPS